MSKLKEKAKFNIMAAELLQRESLYAPSIHCSYYSCLQLLKVTMNEFYEVDYATLEQDIREARTKEKLNTHTYLIKKVGDGVREYSKVEHTQFSRKIKDLKAYREQSDYEDVEITTTESSKAFEIAKELQTQLKTIFNL